MGPIEGPHSPRASGARAGTLPSGNGTPAVRWRVSRPARAERGRTLTARHATRGNPGVRPPGVLVALPLKPALLPPLVSRSGFSLYAPAARSNAGTLSAPQGLRSRGGACACALCLEPALLPPFSALSAFLRPPSRCSPLRPAPRFGAARWRASPRPPGFGQARHMLARPRCGPHGL